MPVTLVQREHLRQQLSFADLHRVDEVGLAGEVAQGPRPGEQAQGGGHLHARLVPLARAGRVVVDVDDALREARGTASDLQHNVCHLVQAAAQDRHHLLQTSHQEALDRREGLFRQAALAVVAVVY